MSGPNQPEMKGKGIAIKIIMLAVLMPAFISCEKYDTDIKGDVEFYILEQYQTPSVGAEILEDGLVLSNNPIISYGEIIHYNSNTYQFRLKRSAIDRTISLSWSK